MLVVAICCGLLSFTGAAFAEGSWSSYLSAVATDFNSRTWADKNSDAANTTIRFDNCREHSGATFSNTEVQLTRETPWYEPDENRGRKTFTCYSTYTGNWGRQPSSSYHFTITKINGCSGCFYRLDANPVKVSY